MMKLTGHLILAVALALVPGCAYVEERFADDTGKSKFEVGYRTGEVYRLRDEGLIVAVTSNGALPWLFTDRLELWSPDLLAYHAAYDHDHCVIAVVPAGSVIRVDGLGHNYTFAIPPVPGDTQILRAYGSMQIGEEQRYAHVRIPDDRQGKWSRISGTSVWAYPRDLKFLELIESATAATSRSSETPIAVASLALATRAKEASDNWKTLAPHFSPPATFVGQRGAYRSPLLFEDGTRVKTPTDWLQRRREILDGWHAAMGAWPPVIERPKIEYRAEKRRENFTQHAVNVETARGQMTRGYLLVPEGDGPFPAVFVPFYEPETSAGLSDKPLRDFAYQLAKRGFVALAIGSPGGDARRPDTAGLPLQPLSFLAYVAANAYQALASLPQVDPARVGIVGHSYGGKWAMFGSCLYDKYAAAAWSDGGVVCDEARPNVNYWEPWYLGLAPGASRKPGVVTADNPRAGAYKTLVESGRDLHELHALMAPRPFLVSGGSEDPPERWTALNHSVEVNRLLGHERRVGMTNRATHDPTPESNEVIYRFFEHFLMGK